MQESENPDGKNAHKVRIVTSYNDIIDGYIYLSKHKRLQDILNDHRQFIPVHVIYDNDTEFTVVQINKASIYTVEESDQIADRMVMFDPLAKPESSTEVKETLLEQLRNMIP